MPMGGCVVVGAAHAMVAATPGPAKRAGQLQPVSRPWMASGQPKRGPAVNLHRLLVDRAEAGRPVRVGLIGCGKFGTMFLAQARVTTGLHVVGVADLAPDRARANLAAAGWPAEQIAAPDPATPMASAPPMWAMMRWP